MPERQPWREEDYDLRKRERPAKMHCGSAGSVDAWILGRTKKRHIHSSPGKPRPLNVGDVVIIHSDDKNRVKWPLGVVDELFEGRDGEVRAVKLCAGKTFLERPIQHLYPQRPAAPPQLYAGAPVVCPKRDVAVAATLEVAYS